VWGGGSEVGVVWERAGRAFDARLDVDFGELLSLSLHRV
jgi:hypothetical protein